MTKKRILTKHQAFHGSEPSWDTPPKENYDDELSKALTYYSTVSLKDKRKSFVEWATDQGASSAEISAIPTEFLITISSQTKMVTRGFVFNKKHTDDMLSKLEQLMKDNPPVIKVVDPSIEMMKNFNKELAVDALFDTVLSAFDNVIDAQMSETKQLKAPTVDCSKLNVGQKQEIVDYYNKQLIELKLVYNKADPELMEGYAGVPRARINKMMKLHINILDELQKQQLIAQAKKPYKPRAKKVKTAKELTSKLKYLTSNKEYDIISIKPEKLVNCTEAWIFNSKNRKLQYYYSDSGITVKGSTLHNFTKGVSLQKTIRKPKEFLSDLMKQPRVRSKKLFDDVNAKGTALTGRINEHCIILKVY